jgi:branched-chain amino acid transport system substrate-binding protein
MTSRKHLGRVLATGVALALVAAACGDDDGGAGGTTTAAEATTTTAGETTTTAGETTTTAGGETTTTTAPEAERFTLDLPNCPAEATTPLADGEPIKVAFVGPQTGPLAGFGLIGEGLKVWFDKVNADDGIAGHPIELILKDDAYDPGRTRPAVQELLERDQIHVSVLQVGTPNVGSVRQLYEDTCTPQAFVGTGFPAWGDPANFPMTSGGILAYNTEARIWAEWIAERQPGAKVATITFNNDFGKSYQTAFKAAADELDLDLVEEVLHEPTSTLTNEVTQMLAAGPDFIVGQTTAGFCGGLATLSRQGGFEGPIVVSSTCFSSQFLGTPEVGEAAVDVYGVGYLKDATDPQWEDDEAMQQYLADVAEFNPSAQAEISSVATGYNFGSLLADVLAEAAEAEGGLTRLSIAEAIWNVNTTLPLQYEGAVYRMNGNDDAYGVEYGEIRVFLPETGTFESTGEIFDLEGQTGLYAG